jgi:hypothetical protein
MPGTAGSTSATSLSACPLTQPKPSPSAWRLTSFRLCARARLYILFRHYTFLNAFSYLCVFLSTVYLTQFALFTGLEIAPLTLYLVSWDHFWMAVGTWATPPLWGRLSPSLIPPIIAVLASPFVFALAQAL